MKKQTKTKGTEPTLPPTKFLPNGWAESIIQTYDTNSTLLKGTRTSTKDEVWILKNQYGQRVALTTQLIQTLAEMYVEELQDDIDEMERQKQTYGGLT
jgi:hypothetical protein